MDGKGTAGRTPHHAGGQRAIHGRVGTLRLDQRTTGGEIARGRAALVDLARAAVVPDASQPAEVWDALADAYAANGEPAKAGAEMVLRGRSGSRARARGRGSRLSAAGWRFPFSGRVYTSTPTRSCRMRRTTRPPAPSPQGRHAPLPGAWPRPGVRGTGHLRGVIPASARAAAPRFSNGSFDR